MWFCPIDGTLLLVRYTQLLYVCACGVCVCFSNVVRYNNNIQHENRVSYRINHACKYLTENRPLGVYLFHI